MSMLDVTADTPATGNPHSNIRPVDKVVLSVQCSFIEHRNYKVIYRRYASLFFLVGIDNDEVRVLTFHLQMDHNC